MGKKKSLRTPSIVITIISVFILALVVYLKNIIQYAILVDIIYPLIEMLCSIAITASIGTYLIEWKGFVEYVQQKLSEIIAKPDMIKNLDSNYQTELLTNLVYERTGVQYESFDGFMKELYNEMQRQSNNYGYYLKEQINHVTCNVYKKSGAELAAPDGTRFRVLEHTRTLTYGNLNSNSQKLKEILTVNVIDDKLFNGDKTVQIMKVLINSRKLEKREYNINVSTNEEKLKIDTMYLKKYTCELKEPIEITDDLKIQIIYSTIEPESDFSYCTRLKQFCKRYKLDFSYDKNSFNIYGQSFVFGERKSQIIKNDTIQFDIDNWLMPGEGTNIYIVRK